MPKSDHGPIEPDQVEMMTALAGALDGLFNLPGLPKTMGFVLLSARFGDIKEGRVNYISNGDRADMIAMLREMLARMEGRIGHDIGHS